jgi:hypothetical protein
VHSVRKLRAAFGNAVHSVNNLGTASGAGSRGSSGQARAAAISPK